MANPLNSHILFGSSCIFGGYKIYDDDDTFKNKAFMIKDGCRRRGAEEHDVGWQRGKELQEPLSISPTMAEESSARRRPLTAAMFLMVDYKWYHNLLDNPLNDPMKVTMEVFRIL